MQEVEAEIMIYVIALTLITLGIFLLAVFLLYKKKQRQSVRRINDLTRELLVAQLEIQEETLKTVSGEIHDNIGQVLSLAKMLVGRMDINRPDDLQLKINDCKEILTNVIRDLRNIAHTLDKDGMVELGLPKAIALQAGMLQKAGFDFEISGDLPRLSSDKEIMIFRIIQEVFNNIIKHAGASRIIVQLQEFSDQIRIIIQDNGRGFDKIVMETENNSRTGLGIRNMENRAKMIGASIQFSSAPGGGTLVTLTHNINPGIPVL